MAGTESPQERQENEMQALKAIYVHELRDMRSAGPWNLWKPLDIFITLTPQQGSSGMQEVHAQIDLHVICSDKYPEEVPQIGLEKSKGLSAQQVTQLKFELDKLADELKGEVMIFELAQHVQKFLHSNNKPGFKSFYEEMVSRQLKHEEQQQHQKKLKEDKERQVIQDEIQRRQKALQEEKKCRKELRLSQQESLDDSALPVVTFDKVERSRSCSHILHNSTVARRRRCQSTSESSEGSQCEHRGTQLIHFNSRREMQVYRGKCIGHSSRGSVVYAAVDLTTGELLAISEWTLKCNQPQRKKLVTFRDGDTEPSELANYMKQISSIEQELNYLQKLHHPNLVNYLNMKYNQDKDNFYIYIAQEFVIGTSISFYLAEHLPVDGDFLRHCANGVLLALEFLHQNNIVHKDLRDTSVFIDKLGCIKVNDYSLDKRLADIYQTSTHITTECSYPLAVGRGGKKADIYRLGVILLSLVKGYIVTDVVPELPSSLQPDLKDFLSKCLSIDERQRWSADQLLSHQFLKAPLDKGLSPEDSLEDRQQDILEGGENEVADSDLHLFMPSNLKGQSRIQNEFEILKWLGKGAFGDVLKVCNKLDGGIYAIKRIELNPKNKQLNRKITREVKLLSRLNHENVVRYFNSWIESATIEPEAQLSSTSQSPSPLQNMVIDEEAKPVIASEDIEGLAPPIVEKSVEWNVSYTSRSSAVRCDSTSSEESSDDEAWISYLPRSESSDGIVFEKDGSETTSDSVESLPNSRVSSAMKEEGSNVKVDETTNLKEIQFMYIQMEFCEKSTLRTAIDNGLCKDEERMWRLFREMVEGLAHIHQQGMIHRDLKPVNIFLDSNDNVKIGDFGLATTNILPRPSSVMTPATEIVASLTDGRSFSNDLGDGSMTGQVGTALYVAPEINVTGSKAIIYNQKVDIYSLGIIFFEMCYHPLQTGMERVTVLLALRNKDIVLPTDFSENDMPQQTHIIRWLLNHDPSQRPTSLELLQSDYFPPPQLEEAALQDMFRHTLSNSQSKAYKYLVSSCFSQEVMAAEDVTFDMSSGKCMSVLLQEVVRESVVRVFRKHGAVRLSTPLLMPRAKLYDSTDSCVRLMTHSGSLVHIPHDLRVPFARYVATNGLANMKRYAIDRVYREKKVFGFHPRELYECAFDIVTPTPGNLMAEAELLSIVWEVVNEFPSLRDRNCTIRLNHTSLLKAILLYCGIEEEKYQDIYDILSDMRDEKYTKFQVQTRLISLCLTDQAMSTLFNLIYTESPITKVSSAIRAITKRKGEVASLAKQGLHDLENIISNAEALGVKCPMVVTPSLVYNVAQYSGMMCQVVCALKKKRRRGGMDVIAAGGRYDNMLAGFRKTLEMTGMVPKEVSQSAAGISISFDKIVSALQDDSSISGTIDVVVCSVGHKFMLREKAGVVRELWAAGIRSTLIDTTQSLEEIQDYCREMLVPHIVMLKDTEVGTIRIRSWEKDRFQERKSNLLELVELIQRLLKLTTDTSETQVASVRSESKIVANECQPSQSSVNQVNFSFLTQEKYPANTRRRLENQMMAHISTALQCLSTKVRVEVLALNLEGAVVKTLASHLELDLEQQDFQKSISLVIEKHPRHKKYLTNICDEIFELKFEKNCSVIILYSLGGNSFKLLM